MAQTAEPAKEGAAERVWLAVPAAAAALEDAAALAAAADKAAARASPSCRSNPP